MTVFYFSATGNSLYVAKQIGGKLYSIPQIMKEGNYQFKDDIIGIVYPCYGFGMPKIVKNFIQKVTWEANYTFAIMTYGNIAAAGLRVMERFAEKSGITFDYMNHLLMVDNYLPVFKMEEQLKKLPEKQIEKNLDIIISDIKTKKQFKPKPNVAVKAITYVLQAGEGIIMGKESDNTINHKFLTDQKCTNCGICSKICPRNNIVIKEKPEFYNHCETCYACIHSCPQNAIHLKNEKSTIRFRNEHVSLKELIDANQQ